METFYGKCTCLKPTGSSLVDYVSVSEALLLLSSKYLISFQKFFDCYCNLSFGISLRFFFKYFKYLKILQIFFHNKSSSKKKPNCKWLDSDMCLMRKTLVSKGELFSEFSVNSVIIEVGILNVIENIKA